MIEENLILFKKKVSLILKELRDRGIECIVKETPSVDNPTYYIEFLDIELKYWKLGIWATGEWSDYYKTMDKTKDQIGITIFMIHKWFFNRWSPNDSNISWEFLSNSLYFDNFINDLLGIKKNPIKSYCDILYDGNILRKNYVNTYLKDWYFNEVYIPTRYKVSNVWSSKLLFKILKLISIFDRRVKGVRVYSSIEGDVINYTFSFLATSFCSKCNKSFLNFYKLYSYYPNKLKKIFNFRLFNANYNVSDYFSGLTESKLNDRMFKGVIAESI